MVKIVFYAPIDNYKMALNAIFTEGAGVLGNYDQCCFISEGVGQFCARKGANPSIGKINILEQVKEYKIEVICPKSILTKVIKVLKENHPYEEPAIDIFELYNFFPG